ncbi:MAG TPA: hypothetical protein VM029_07050 [Opitutaceae bacterium]|nr:hypothetical protein [Opitutaceae bacterium]
MKLFARLRRLGRHARLEAEMSEEMRAHLELRVDPVVALRAE